MILTVTVNPALDYTVRLDRLDIGKRAKYRDPSIDPAGKGINVSRMAHRLGAATLALGFAAGPTGTLLRQRLDEEAVPHDLLPTPGLTRINVTLLTGPEGAATHLHGPGSPIDSDDLKLLMARASEHLSRATILVLSGSLPPGVPPEAMVSLVTLAKSRRVLTLVDAESAMLAAAIGAGADLVKPNSLEAGEFLRREVAGVEAAVTAAREIRARGVGTVIVTLRADGAVAVDGTGAWHVQPPKDLVVRAIGAGDSFAAGLAVALSRGLRLPEALRLAAASGAATARHSGTGLGSRAEVDELQSQVQVCQLP
ncbi:MAG TPA: 1-phosphofructokinase family hexose kinase [Planctomycetota bacterium]|nr:1-phosphofructokinase family hexose kinase [Planctomycetota bacterium]